MGEVLPRTLSVLRDGFAVWLFPVSTFERAADRELSGSTIFGVLFFVALAYAVATTLASMALLQGAFADQVPLIILSEMLWAFFHVLAGGVVLYGAVRLFGGAASVRRMYSAMLVFPALQFVVALVIVLIIAVILPMLADRTTVLGIALPLRSILSMALLLVTISYTVLAARFGGAVGYPAAIGASLVFFGVVVLFQAVSWTLFP